MSSGKEIILYEGVSHPIMAEKIRYYDDPIFMRNYLGHGKASMPRMKDRLAAAEYYPPVATQIVRDARRKYSRKLEEGVEATIVESGIRQMAIGNFIGNIIESNSSKDESIQNAA